MSQSQQSRGEDEDEDMHETTQYDLQSEEDITRHESSPTTTPLSFSITKSPSAADILQPLSTLAAQRSFPLPTSGSLASLARGHQRDPADGRRIDHDFASATSGATSISTGTGSSWMHERLLQSDSTVDATTTTDLDDVGASSITTSAAVRDFTTMVWASSTAAAVAEETKEAAESTTESKPIHRSVSAYSSSPFSSPGSSLVEGSSGPFEEEQDDQTIFLSPFASIFPDGANTITPLFLQRFDDDSNNDDAADADQRTILKYSESIQLFRRRPEDGGKTWKRRVFEYR